MTDAKQIQELRQKTGAGMMDVKNALDEANGNEEQAIEILRKKGALKAAKKASERETKEGIVYAYVHSNNKTGVLLELDCETDFVAKNEEFVELAKDIAMQIAAMNPLYISPNDVPEEVVSKEREIIKESDELAGKPEQVVEKIVDGKIAKYFEEACLLKQAFIKDDKKTVEDIITEKVAKIGEKIEVGRFCRYEI